jgi:hypothetical protein
VDGLIMQVTQRIASIEVAHYPRAEGRSNYTLKRLALAGVPLLRAVRRSDGRRTLWAHWLPVSCRW